MPTNGPEPDPEVPPGGEDAGSTGPTQPDRPAGEPGPAPLTPSQQAELSELRERVKALEGPGRPARHRLRSASSAVLIVLASVLSLLAVVAVWANDQVTDTDRYVATVAPLASNPDVQNAITNRVTTVVLAQIDVQGAVNQISQTLQQQGVPPRAADAFTRLSGPITSGLTDLVSAVVHNVVSSDAFATIWTNVNRQAHASLNKALTGQGGGAVQLQGNQVTLDVAPIVAQVKDRLVASGFGPAAAIPTVSTQFTIASSNQINSIRTYLRLLQILGNWLPVIAVLIAAIGVFLAKNRRRALIGAALGVAAAMVVLGIGLAVFRSFYLDRLPPDASQAAAGAFYDALVSFLRVSLRAVFTIAVVTAIGAFLVGPSRVAVAVRDACRSGMTALRDVATSVGFRAGPVGPFVSRYKRWIGGVILLAGAVTLLLWDHPTTAVILYIVLVVLLGFAVREFLDTSPDQRRRAPGPTALPGGSTGGA